MSSGAPVCHIPVDETIKDQPRPARFPPVPVAVDIATAIAAINALRLVVQQLAGQTPHQGPQGLAGLQGRAGVSVVGAVGAPGPQGAPGRPGTPGQPGAPGAPGRPPKDGRFIEDRSQRVTQTIRVFQDNDDTSENWVDVKQINQIVWQDRVTGELIVWER